MITSCIDAVSSWPSAPAHREPPVLGLAGQPVLEDDHRGDHLGALQVGDVVALDAQRRLGQVERLLQLLQRHRPGRQVAGAAGLVQVQRLPGVARDRLEQRPLVAALRHPQVDPGAAQTLEPGRDLVRRRGAAPAPAPRAAPPPATRRRPAAAGARPGRPVPTSSTFSTTQPRWPRIRPPRTWKTWTAASSSSSARANTSASVPSASTTALFSRARLQGADVVAQPGGPLELQRRRRLAHLALEPAHEAAGVAGHEVAEVLGERAVLLGVDPADAGRRALADVAEQAGPADLAGPLEDAVAAGAHREHPQQQVDGLADRPGVRVRAEVAGALALGAAHHLDPRELLAHRHGEVGVGLVVAVLDVEPRVVLLDPGVLELQRLDLGGDHRPLDAGRRGDHRLGARVQRGDVLEVGAQPRAQALRLADVDDAAVLVAEPVHPGLDRDLPGCGSVRRGVGHVANPTFRRRQACRSTVISPFATRHRHAGERLLRHAVRGRRAVADGEPAVVARADDEPVLRRC